MINLEQFKQMSPEERHDEYRQFRFRQQAELLKLDNDAGEHEVDAALDRATKTNAIPSYTPTPWSAELIQGPIMTN